MKRAVLVGAGHAHLYTLKRAREFVRRGYELVLVAPGPFWYSGLATGVLGGAYPPSLDKVDVAALAKRGGGRFIEDAMSGLDPAGRKLILRRNGDLSFDVLSLNLGSECPAIPGESEETFAAKPIPRVLDLKYELERRFRSAPAGTVRVAVGGGGVTGLELAANIARLAEVCGGQVEITVYVRGEQPVRSLPPAARRALLKYLSDRDVRIRLNAAIERIENGRLLLADGGEAPFQVFLNATGLRPPTVLRAAGLPLSTEGALVVDRHLKSPAAPQIFGGGDCIALAGHSLPRIGVFAIRQAPVIFHNLLAVLSGAELRRFEPQKHFLAIMTLGDGGALAVRGKFWWHGRAAFWLKDWIDRRFLREYQEAAGHGPGDTA